MTLVNCYATGDALRDSLRDQLTAHATAYDAALNAASRLIDNWTGRIFYQTALTAKIFRPDHCDELLVPDIATSAGLIVAADQDNDGNFETVWNATDYELGPLDRANGRLPFNIVRAVGSNWFPVVRDRRHGRYSTYPYRRRASVQITAHWGFPAIPDEVAQACLLLAGDFCRAPDAGARVFAPGQQSPSGAGFFFSTGRAGVGLGNDLAEALLLPLRVVAIA